MSSYSYYNLNPYNKRTGDCVIRATAGALDITWDEASDLLYYTAKDLGCEMSCIGCYSSLFAFLDLEELPVNGMTVDAVADAYPDDTLIIRIKGHLTCARRGRIFDIWDCREEIVDRAWIVE